MSEISFEDYNLSEEITRSLDTLGYECPTQVQSKAIPLVLEKKDIVVKSQTGSGKTASYAIPICELIDWMENKPQALILTPTRELAVQVKEDFINIGRFKRVKATAVYGRHSFSMEKTELKQKSHVVVGTPGRLLDHIERETIALDKISYLVIDEADEMLNMGFIEQVKKIIKELPYHRVTMLFSATLPEEVKNLSQKYMISPQDIEMEESGMTTDNIEHALYQVAEINKFLLLKDVMVMENPDSCLIFCRTKERVDSVYDRFKNLGYPCKKLHGGMEQDTRLEVMNDFRRGEFRFLIATDVAARGIDIENITLVINYDIPWDKENYVHRTGRTGRAGLTGKAITFVSSMEKRYLLEIEEYIGFKLPRIKAPSNEEVSHKMPDFEKKIKAAPMIKKLKGDQLNKQIMKLYFNGGKKKKLRAVDFVGTIAKIDGITAEDIGIITISETVTYVEILNGKGSIVLKAMQKMTIKGKVLKVSEADKK